MAPLGDTIMETFDVTPAKFGLLMSSYTLSAGVVGFLSAFVVDRYDRRDVLLAVYAGFVLGTFACALASDYWLLLIARTLTGAFGGVLGALGMSVIGDVIPDERRGTALGQVMAAFSLATVLGVPFGYYLAQKWFWNAPFWLLGGLGVLICGLVYAVVPPIRGHLVQRVHVQPLALLTNTLRDVRQLHAMWLMGVVMMAQFVIIPFIAPYMRRNVGFDDQDITYIYMLGGALTIFTSPFFGKLADRHGKRRLFTIFAVLVIIPVVAMTHMPAVHVGIALIFTSLFFVFSGGRMIPMQAMITASVPPASRGSFMSIISSVQQLSSSFASLLASLIVTEQFKGGPLQHFHLAGYLSVAACLLSVWIGRKLRPVPVKAEVAAPVA